ncbi:MAG: ACT domain-containing protein [Armatimonadetes bacterium]|jgi:hypothetical protein|nr:ACT domain-containing protein [Armatimonadota bacterium]
MKVNQISVFLENKSGRLADVTRTLAQNGINIRALSIADTVDYGLLRLIVDHPQHAAKVLSDYGFTVAQTEVLAIAVPDRPGGLAGIIDILSAKDLNIEYMYAFVGRSGDHAIVIFRIEPVEDAIAALQQGGAQILTGEQLHAL